MQKQPKTLIEAIQYFADPKVCVEYVKRLRWEDGVVVCPRCESQNVTELATRQLWQCKGCRKQFSVKVGTIFEDSALPLSKWLPAVWIITNAKNGVSSYEISRAIGTSQKSAWHMMHRIREAMRVGSFVKLQGVVEADETYVGGKIGNKHVWERIRNHGKGPIQNKIAVMGMVERGGRVVAKVIEKADSNTLIGELLSTVDAKATIYTDDLAAYDKLGKAFKHEQINHKWEYVRGEAHTNTIEGFWSLFKRCIKGTYIHVAPFHIDRYLDEQSARYNMRKTNDYERFHSVMLQVFGRRLTWNQLVDQG